MADNAQTRLDWVVTGQQQVKQMATALRQLANVQKQLNSALGAGGTQQKIASATAHTATNTRVLVTLMKQQLALTRQIAGGTQNVTNQTRQATNAARGLLISWQSVGRIIVGSLISRGIGRFLREIRDAATETAEFERRISELRTISQNAQLGFEHWAGAVRRLSDEFNRQPLDVIEAMYQTLSNQVAEGTQAISFMEEALRLSLITVSSTTESVQALTAAINAYGYTTADARYISDQFFKTVELGRLRLGEIANTIGRVYVLGSQLGVALEEVNASMAALTIQGIPASEAMTWLRNVMLKLIRPTDAMKELFARWGVSSGQAAIETWGFAGVLRKLKAEVASGNGELEELGELFNRIRAVTGAAGLVGNIETLEEALEQMKTAGEDAAKAFDLIRESAGFKLQQELQKVKNFFTIELGREILAGLYEFTEAFGGLANVVKTVTNTLIKLGAILAATFGAAALAQIAAFVWSIGNISITMGVAAAATAALNTQVTILGISFNALTLGIGAALAAVGYLGYTIWRDFQNAKKSVMDFASAVETDVTIALNNMAQRENEINAARVRAAAETADQMKQVYLQAIAEQTAALTRLKQIEADRVNLASLLFDMKMKTAGTAEKERLIYERLLYLRQELSEQLKQEEKDWKAINAIQTDIASTYGLASGLQDKMFRTMVKLGSSTNEAGRKQTVYVEQVVKGSQRIEQLMRAITGDVQRVNNEYAKIPIATEEQIQKAEEAIQKENEKAAKIDQVKERQDQVKQKLEETNGAQKALIDNMDKLLGKFDQAAEAAARTAMWSGEGAQYAFDPEGWKEWVATLENFKAAVVAIRESLAQAVQQGQMTPEQVAVFKAQIAELKAAYEGAFAEAIPITGMDEFLTKMGEMATSLQEITQAKTSLQFKLDNINYALETGAIEAQWFRDNMEQLGATGVISMAEIMRAADVTTSSLDRMLIWLNMTLRVTELNIQRLETAIQRAQQLNATVSGGAAPGQWAGGMATRFAAGGSVGSDSVHALLRPGEFIMNKDAARQYFPQLVSMNAGAARFSGGGEVVNNNIGDINVTVQGGDTSDITVRRIASSLRRELKRGTVRLS